MASLEKVMMRLMVIQQPKYDATASPTDVCGVCVCPRRVMGKENYFKPHRYGGVLITMVMMMINHFPLGEFELMK